jgi:cyclic beta-1,2-glucan synthetase
MVTAAGSGYSRWRELAITRWRPDVTSDDTGSFIFLRDVASGERWSTGFQPTGAVPLSYDVSFADDRAEFIRHDGGIETRLEIIVPPTHDAEVRRVSLTNHGSETREIEATSYAEIVLATAASDLAHPAFSNPGGVSRGVATISLDGIALGENEVLSLVDDGRAHLVRVIMAQPSATPDPVP